MNNLTPIHPGEVLKDELEEIGISQSTLAKHIGVPLENIDEICSGKLGINAPVAWKLSKAFGAGPLFWMNLQSNWELNQVDETTLSNIEKIINPLW